MARVLIEFDTATDTLEDIVQALQIDMTPRGEGTIEGTVRFADTPPFDAPRDDHAMTAEEARVHAEWERQTAELERQKAEPTEAEPVILVPNVDLLEAAKLGPTDGDRRRGEARPGKIRRTNAQIADDNRWFTYLETIKAKGNAALAEADKSPAAQAEDVGEANGLQEQPASAGDDGAAISTGGVRENPEDAAQDAKDEEAESAAAKGEAPVMADLQKAVGGYMKKFGMEAASAKVPGILGKPVIAHEPAEIADAIAKIEAAMMEAPAAAKFTPVDTGVRETQMVDTDAKLTFVPTGTIEDVRAAMLDYARKFDGSEDPMEMKCAAADMPRLLQGLFGTTVTTPKLIPPTPENFARATVAVRAAIEKSPFGRIAK